jgi:hypothetical protein
MMSIAGDIGWSRNTVSYDAILEKVRATNGSNASLEDLSMFNQQCAEDPLEALLRMEDSDEWSDETLPDPTLYKTVGEVKMSAQMKEALIEAGIQSNDSDEPSIVITPALHEMLDEMMQFNFKRLVTGAYWVSSLLHESADGRPDDFTPCVEDCKAGIAQAITGIEVFAYNRDDTQERDPARKGMSGGQWNFLSNMAKQATESVARMDTLKGAGYTTHTSFEAQYEEVLTEAKQRAREKQIAANQREMRRQDTLKNASASVQAKLANIIG